MNFLEMQTELSNLTGALNSAISSDLTKIKKWLNRAQQDITSRQNWPFMLKHEIIQTVTDITTGTCSISSGGTTVTFTSAPAVSVTDYFIKFSSSNNWYKITDHTAASTTATVTPAYGEASSLSGGTYVLRKLFYATSTPLDSIYDVKQTTDGRLLESISPTNNDVFSPLYFDSGTVYGYFPTIPDSSGGLRLSFLYSPSSVINLQVRGVSKLTDMSSDTDQSIIPVRWHSTLLDMATFYALSSLDDDRANDFYKKAELGVQDMMKTYSYDFGRHRVTRPLTPTRTAGPLYTLPPQFGPMV